MSSSDFMTADNGRQAYKATYRPARSSWIAGTDIEKLNGATRLRIFLNSGAVYSVDITGYTRWIRGVFCAGVIGSGGQSASVGRAFTWLRSYLGERGRELRCEAPAYSSAPVYQTHQKRRVASRKSRAQIARETAERFGFKDGRHYRMFHPVAERARA